MGNPRKSHLRRRDRPDFPGLELRGFLLTSTILRFLLGIIELGSGLRLGRLWLQCRSRTMSNLESDPQLDSQPSIPFAATPTQPAGGGCGRVGVIGCGVVTLLLGIAAIVFLLKAGDLFAWAMTQFEVEITKALPEDCTESDRRNLREAFASAGDAVRAGDFDPGALQSLQAKLRESLLDEDSLLTREQVLELTAILRQVAGEQVEDELQEEEDLLAPVAA